MIFLLSAHPKNCLERFQPILVAKNKRKSTGERMKLALFLRETGELSDKIYHQLKIIRLNIGNNILTLKHSPERKLIRFEFHLGL